MDANALQRFWKAEDKTKELFKTRRAAEDWGRNIIEGSEGLESKLEWGNYYSFLAKPNNFTIKNSFIYADADEKIEYEYPEHMKTVIHKNGSETFIHIKNEKYY